MSSLDSNESSYAGLETVGSRTEPPTTRETTQIQRVLRFPDLFPEEFKGWIQREIERNPPRLLRTDLAGGGSGGGTPGPTGPEGPAGPAGPAGVDAVGYEFTQGSPATTWTVTHNLGRHPSVTVVDTGDSVVIPNVLYTSMNALTITFDSATSGKAYLN